MAISSIERRAIRITSEPPTNWELIPPDRLRELYSPQLAEQCYSFPVPKV